MNAFAAVRTGRALAECTLLSTQQPCSMCAAAAAFLGVGLVRYLAPDPWALASGQPDRAVSVGPAADLWVVTANLLFLLSIASRAGVDHPTVVGNRELEPETAGGVDVLVADGLVAGVWTMVRWRVEVLDAQWDRIVAVAAASAERTGSMGRAAQETRRSAFRCPAPTVPMRDRLSCMDQRHAMVGRSPRITQLSWGQ